MHRDHGFHNLLGTEDGVITKAIDWGAELWYEHIQIDSHIGLSENEYNVDLSINQSWSTTLIRSLKCSSNPSSSINLLLRCRHMSLQQGNNWREVAPESLFQPRPDFCPRWSRDVGQNPEWSAGRTQRHGQGRPRICGQSANKS